MDTVMRAAVYREYGEAEVLAVAEAPVPSPGPGQVLVRIAASGVNPVDAKLRSGFMAQRAPADFPVTPGQDLTGTVVALGDGAAAELLGAEVVGFGTGTAAEYAVADPVLLVPRPATVPAATAAALPTVAETARRLLDQLELGAGERLLVLGGSGGVGGMLIRFAIARGATVTATSGADSLAGVTALGARALDREGEWWSEAGPQDAVLDTAGHGGIEQALRLANPARIITIADYAAAAAHGLQTSPRPGHVREMIGVQQALDAIAGGAVLEVRDFPLDSIAAAHRLIESGHAHARVVVTL